MLGHRSILVLLVLITLAAFWRATACGFVHYDDDVYVTDNPHVQQGLTVRNMGWAVTTGAAGYWHPLTWLSLMLDSQVFGPGPHGHHLGSVLLHALAVGLLYTALVALTGSCWRSGLVAVLWAVHPLRVESVAWISERKDVLSGCLAFATLLAYADYARRPNRWRYAAVVILYAAGLMAKPILVTLPFLLLLLDIWPLGRIAGMMPLETPTGTLRCPPRSVTALAMEKIPLFLLTVAFSATTYMTQHNSGAVTDLEHIPFTYRLANTPISYVRYMVKMVWFRGLTIEYPYETWAWWQVAGAMLMLALISIGVWTRRRSSPWLALGWLWCLGMLFPVIGLVQAGPQSMADRFTYLPAVGLLVMLVWSLPDRFFHTKPGLLKLGGATLVVVAVLCVFTWRQIGYWKDGETLFKHVLAFWPDSDMALTNLGVTLDQEGRPQAALVYLQKAVAIQPQDAKVQSNLGNALVRLNHPDEAVPYLRRAVELRPDLAPLHHNLGIAYMHLGQIDMAIQQFQLAIGIDHDYVAAHFNLGNAYVARRQWNQALMEYQATLSLDPDNANAYFNAAKALANLGRLQETLKYIQEFVRLRPGLARGYGYLGQTLARLNRLDEAVAYMKKAIQLDSDDAALRVLLAQTEAARQRLVQQTRPAVTQP